MYSKTKKIIVVGSIKNPTQVNLISNTGDTQTFKSIYATAKFLGVNPGSVSSKKNTDKIIKSKHDGKEYTVIIANSQ